MNGLDGRSFRSASLAYVAGSKSLWASKKAWTVSIDSHSPRVLGFRWAFVLQWHGTIFTQKVANDEIDRKKREPIVLSHRFVREGDEGSSKSRRRVESPPSIPV